MSQTSLGEGPTRSLASQRRLRVLLLVPVVVTVGVLSRRPKDLTLILVCLLGLALISFLKAKLGEVRGVLLLVAFCLPVEMLPGVELIYADLDLTTPLLLVALLYLFLLALGTGKIRLRRTPVDMAILVFVVAQIVVLILAPWRLDSLIRYLKYNKVFVLYHLITTHLRSRHTMVAMIKLYALSAILVSLYGVLAFALFVVTGHRLWGLGFSWGYLPRIYGTMRDQNIFAAYMIPPLFLVLSAYLRGGGRLRRAALILALGILLLALLFTWSRSGFLGLAASGIVYVILNRSLANRMLVRLAPTVIGTLLVIGLIASGFGYSPLLLVERLTGDAYGARQSDQMHYYLARLGLEVFLEHPLGVGRSNIMRYVGCASVDTQMYFVGTHKMNNIGEVNGVYQGWPLHSSWLEVLVAEGIIGFLAFAFIAMGTVRCGVRAMRCTPDPVVRAILSSLVAGFVGILLSAAFYTFDWMYFFWFLIAMIVAASLSVGQCRPSLV